MKTGLIGSNLKHSYSKIIHNIIENNNYELINLDECELKSFLLKKEFEFVNVTIPYKEKVIPFVDRLSLEAKEIKAINLIVNLDNKLYGYNTDYLAFKKIIEINNIDINNKTILVLGTGGTAKTVTYYLKQNQNAIIYYASRFPNNKNILSYNDINKYEFDIVINTTPVGMYPNLDEQIIDANKLKVKEVVIDFIYNPYRTLLEQNINKYKNIKYINGLDILIYQALFTYNYLNRPKNYLEYFNKIKKMLLSNRNIVLIGMPSAGKTVIGEMLNKELKNKQYFDTDQLIENKYGNIQDIFNNKGENYFRTLESEVISEVALKRNAIISTGGGVINCEKNINLLKANGILIFIDKPLDKLKPSDNRPLSSNTKDLLKLYNERYNKYLSSCDIHIKGDTCEECFKYCLEVLKTYE